MQALKSFCRAVHLNPANTELLEDDLTWAAELVRRKASLENDKEVESTSTCSENVIKLATDANGIEGDDQFVTLETSSCSSLDEQFTPELEKLPPNYVAMRR